MLSRRFRILPFDVMDSACLQPNSDFKNPDKEYPPDVIIAKILF
jgi:hypothetical protein